MPLYLTVATRMPSNNPSLSTLSLIPGFAELTHAQKTTIQRDAKQLTIGQGDTIFSDHSACNDFIFLLNGEAQVQKISANGHEIILYHLTKGNTCGLTASCLLGQAEQHANLIAETLIEIILLPHTAFKYYMQCSVAFNAFVITAIDRDFNALLHLMEDMNSSSIENRLVHQIISNITGKAKENPIVIKVTHHSLATELGTAREVVSRCLEKLAQKKYLRLHRGTIEILNLPALKNLIKK